MLRKHLFFVFVLQILYYIRIRRPTVIITVTVVYVPEVGTYELKSVKFQDIEIMIQEVLGL